MKTLDQNQEPHRLLFQNLSQGVIYTDGDGRICAVNPAAEKILGLSAVHLSGNTSIDPLGRGLRNDGTPFPPHEQPICLALSTGEAVRNVVMGLFHPGQNACRWVSIDAIPQYRPDEAKPFQVITTLNDITDRRMTEEENRHLAFYDSLTGLPNRRLLLDRLDQAIAQASRKELLVGVAFLDLDHFKAVNDTLGHAGGDSLLRAVAARLRKCIRNSDTVARLGGDEFVLVLSDLEDPADATAIADKILKAFELPFRIGERDTFSTVSLGIALYPLDSDTGEELLGRADLAMYQAKEEGRNRFLFYSTRMNEESRQRLLLYNDLHRGLRRGELSLYFQEKTSLGTGEITGVEALLRWRHPERGLLRPAEFLQTIEESDLIIPVGEWILRSACSQGVLWEQQGLGPLRIGVNISERQLRHGDLVEMVRRVLDETGLPPGRLELEFREAILLEETNQARASLAALRAMGVGCTLDDFGTGLSAIGSIRTLPLDRLNIHHSLVHNFAAAEYAGLIRSIVELAHNLHLEVVAEGVETDEQRFFLKALGCDEVQGYHFRSPIPPEELSHRLTSCDVQGVTDAGA